MPFRAKKAFKARDGENLFYSVCRLFLIPPPNAIFQTKNLRDFASQKRSQSVSARTRNPAILKFFMHNSYELINFII